MYMGTRIVSVVAIWISSSTSRTHSAADDDVHCRVGGDVPRPDERVVEVAERRRGRGAAGPDRILDPAVGGEQTQPALAVARSRRGQRPLGRGQQVRSCRWAYGCLPPRPGDSRLAHAGAGTLVAIRCAAGTAARRTTMSNNGPFGFDPEDLRPRRPRGGRGTARALAVRQVHDTLRRACRVVRAVRRVHPRHPPAYGAGDHRRDGRRSVGHLHRRRRGRRPHRAGLSRRAGCVAGEQEQHRPHPAGPVPAVRHRGQRPRRDGHTRGRRDDTDDTQ